MKLGDLGMIVDLSPAVGDQTKQNSCTEKVASNVIQNLQIPRQQSVTMWSRTAAKRAPTGALTANDDPAMIVDAGSIAGQK